MTANHQDQDGEKTAGLAEREARTAMFLARHGFALMFAGLMAALLLTLFIRDPKELTELHNQLNRQHELHVLQVTRSNDEIKDLRAALDLTQQALRDNQQELLRTQEALSRAQRALIEVNRNARSVGPVSPSSPHVSEAKPLSALERLQNAQNDLRALRQAVTNNNREYLETVRALAQTNKDLAMARESFSPPAATGKDAVPASERPVEAFLSPTERDLMKLLMSEPQPEAPVIPADPPVVLKEISQRNQELVEIQDRLVEAQGKLMGAQSELSIAQKKLAEKK